MDVQGIKDICSPYTDVNVQDSDLWELLKERFNRDPTQIALVDGKSNESYSYAMLLSETENIAWNLVTRFNFSRTKPVLIYMKSCVEYMLIAMAVWKLGGLVVVANPLLKQGELSSILRIISCSVIFCDEGNATTAVNASKHIQNKTIFTRGTSGKMLSITELKKKRCGELGKFRVNPRTDIALIPFSSGTTGLSKGVEITHRALVGQIRIWGGPEMSNLPESCGVLYQPFSHIYGFTVVLIHLAMGVKAVIMEGFDLEKYVQLVSFHQSDHLYLVPPIAVVLCKSQLLSKYNLDCVRMISTGGAPLGKDVEEQLQTTFGEQVLIRQLYGLTEAAGGCMGMPVKLMMKNNIRGSIGCPFPNVRAKVIDIETGKSLGPDQSGQICLKCEFFMRGYLNNPEANARTKDKHGWLHTGDIGYYNGEGFFFIVDRLKELIKYKGYQVAPAELEDLLLKHPDVADAGVTGLPDRLCGEVPHAWVVRRAGSGLSEGKLHGYINERVATFKKLRGGISFVESIPKSPSGKILRREIKRLSLEELKNKPTSKL